MNKAAIIYWSGAGNTEAMAREIESGMKQAFGCPSMGDEVLEEDAFEPFFASVEASLAGKKLVLFGSYGWGDGQWMRDWVTRAQTAGASLMDEGLIMQDAPDETACAEYGKKFAAF